MKRIEIHGAVRIYSGIFNNPFIIWGPIKRKSSDIISLYLSSFTTLKWMVYTEEDFLLQNPENVKIWLKIGRIM